MRRIPVISSLVVLLAVGLMVSLGLWQLARMHQKEALLAHYAQAAGNKAEVEWPTIAAQQEALLYRQARLDCRSATQHSSMAGRNAAGLPGLAQTARCALPDGSSALVVLGWSADPKSDIGWKGGEVHGVIAPGPRLIAMPPVDGLAASALPDPADIPNNHFSYAIQWFLFALTALVIYGLVLRRHAKDAGDGTCAQ